MKLILAAVILTVSLTKAQTNDAKISKEISAEQKGYLSTTWYESPKESSGNTLVYRLTEYTMVVGQDFFPHPPGKITFNNAGNFNGENIKVGKTATPSQMNSGKWNINGNNISLDFGKQKNKLSIVSIEKDKLVLISE